MTTSSVSPGGPSTPGPSSGQQRAQQTAPPTRPDVRRRHPQAPSLDAIATHSEQQPPQREDSRSSSSTNSPALNEYEESDFFNGANDSESSLGVPNLQDMQVADSDVWLPPINRLPNEILIGIFARLSSSADQLHCMLTCKRWARNTVDQLWHRPSCTSWDKYQQICQTLSLERPYFSYKDFVKRLNLAALADRVHDDSVQPLAVCSRVERLTLPNCKNLTDTGLVALVQNNSHLLALDISCDDEITEQSVFAIAEHCKRLQGLNISNCTKVSNESLVQLAKNCRYIKRLKLNECRQVGDEAILAFAEHCPNLLEIDLHQCRMIGNASVTKLLASGQYLRELRLVWCDRVDDSAFLSVPPGRTFENLRVLDLTSCQHLTDRGVEKIIDAAPRLRNLVLSKCRLITDVAVFAIAGLQKNLHYVHLGHCNLITDEAVKRLVHYCTRIRYIDLGCCVNLTDESVVRLATLPKLKRIGLVKCAGITDDSIIALAKANQRNRQRRDVHGNVISNQVYVHSSLERVHLSYCVNLTLKGIIRLLNACPRLTHLSLTGVHAFLREDLAAYCRDAPREFTEHQRTMFCVFSGAGVQNLRRFLNGPGFLDMHDPSFHANRRHSVPGGAHPPAPLNAGGPGHIHAALDASFDAEEPDAIDDDDGLDDMAIDPPVGAAPGAWAQPPGAPAQTFAPGGVFPTGGVPPPPFIPAGAHGQPPPPSYQMHPPSINLESGLAGPSTRQQQQQQPQGPPSANGASAANFAMFHPHLAQTHPLQGGGASGAGPSGSAAGPSTASVHGGAAMFQDVENGVASPASSSGSVD